MQGDVLRAIDALSYLNILQLSEVVTVILPLMFRKLNLRGAGGSPVLTTLEGDKVRTRIRSI